MKLSTAKRLFSSFLTIGLLMAQAAGLSAGKTYTRREGPKRPCTLCGEPTRHPGGFCSVDCRRMYKTGDNIARGVGKAYHNFVVANGSLVR